ncbi:protein kinase [Achlya hypogyna]|uniref:Protein kinase n=1 Tax=Achlya hypogyna TaxID=1202772 RepID=A0A1V9ZJW4_ACHHY|nr:protein kinase [Achlya hypogyna]
MKSITVELFMSTDKEAHRNPHKRKAPVPLALPPTATAQDVIRQYHATALGNSLTQYVSRGQILAKVAKAPNDVSAGTRYKRIADIGSLHENEHILYRPCTEMQQLLEQKCITPAVLARPQLEQIQTPSKDHRSTLKRKERTASEDRRRLLMMLTDPAELTSGIADDGSDDDEDSSRHKHAKASPYSKDVHTDPMLPVRQTPPSQQHTPVDMLSKNFANLDVDTVPVDSDIDDTPDIFMSLHPRRNAMPVHESPTTPTTDANVFLPLGKPRGSSSRYSSSRGSLSTVTSSPTFSTHMSPSLLSMDIPRHSAATASSRSRPSLESPCRRPCFPTPTKTRPSSASNSNRPSLDSTIGAFDSMRTGSTVRASSDLRPSDLSDAMDTFDENAISMYTPFSYAELLSNAIPVRSDFFAKYSLGNQLGHGSFSTVSECFPLAGPATKLAVKVIDKLAVHEPRFLSREIEIMSSLNHPGIVKLLELYETPDQLYLVMEFCEKELFQYIDEHGPLSEAQAKVLLRKLIQTTAYLHKNAIVHRDIKPENILIVQDDVCQVKLSDFGIARRLQGPRHSVVAEHSVFADESENGFRPRERFARAHTKCGTRDYVAPEVMSGKGYGTQADMWSIGVVLYVVLSGYAPMFGPIEGSSDLTVQFTEECWDTTSAGAKHLIRSLLVRNPDKRMTATEAMMHQWLR